MKIMGKKIAYFGALAVLILVVALIATGCNGKNDKDDVNTATKGTIIVGSDDYPPFNYEDTNGNLTGIDVDLAKEAFGRLGYEIEFKAIDWEKKKELVDAGKIDCIWGSFSIDGREKDYKWTDAYMYSRQVVAVRKDSGINSLTDLAGKTVAVQSTTKPEEIFLIRKDPRIPQVKEVFSLQNRELVYPYLSEGYADAIAAHETSIIQCMKDYELEYKIIEDPLQVVGLGVAFSKKDKRGLEKQLSEAFEEMRQDGSMKRIIGKYLENPEKYMEGWNDEE